MSGCGPQLGLEALLERLGFNGTQRALAMATIIARMAAPGSERASWRWLCERSALGELLGVDFERMSMMRLYRASDALLARRAAIEAHLFEQVADLFALPQTVTLYDLTNTFFEGEAAAQPNRTRPLQGEAQRPLLTLGLVLDVRSVRGRGPTLADARRLAFARPPPRPMSSGCARTATAIWSSAGNAPAASTRTWRLPSRPGRARLHVHKVVEADGGEVRLLLLRGAGRRNALPRASPRASRVSCASSTIKRPRTRKRLDHVWQRIGRIKERPRCRGALRHRCHRGDSGKKARAAWERRARRTMITHPGVYCLRTNVEDWDEETLWRTYTALTDVEAVFRSLKSELGLRPIFHQTQKRSDGHLFITVIAYQLVQTIRRRLASWASLRRILEGQQRITATFRRKDGRTLHVRKPTRAELRQRAIYQTLGADPVPGGIRKMIV